MVTYDCQPLREHAPPGQLFFFEQNTKNQGLFYIPNSESPSDLYTCGNNKAQIEIESCIAAALLLPLFTTFCLIFCPDQNRMETASELSRFL